MKKLKIGQSTDIHKIKRSLFNYSISLGLTTINAHFYIKAWSDGDILIHAIAEAIIGALGLKDLGSHFPNNLENKNISGKSILMYCNELLIKHKYQIINIDSLIILDNLFLNPYLDTFQTNISKILQPSIPYQLNIKATTSENKFSKIIQAQAIVLICQQN